MARKKHRKERERNEPKLRRERRMIEKEMTGGRKERWHSELHPETKKSVLSIISFTAAVVFILSSLGMGGKAGQTLFDGLSIFLGKGYFLVPLFLVSGGFLFLFSERKRIVGTAVIGGGVLICTILALFNLLFGPDTGGAIGSMVSVPLLRFFDFWGALVIVFGVLASALLLIFNMPIRVKRPVLEGGEEATGVEPVVAALVSKPVEQPVVKGMPVEESAQEQTEAAVARGTKDVLSVPLLKRIRKMNTDYKFPPLDLLQGDRGKPSSGDIRANVNIIKRTLENFGIIVDMDQVSIGPTVTQYTLKPAEGVKLSRILALNNDLSLALAAHPLRIEAPIPGKSLVGIEVPNKSVSLVGLRSLIENAQFQEAAQPLLISLGRDVTGNAVYSDLAKMPHLMISGATGSGKSVSMHSIITSLLYRNTPDNLRFLIVDPKRVELSIYNEIPHLITGVITEAKKTIRALKWAVSEMDRRYELLSRYHARDLLSFNSAMATKQSTRAKDDTSEIPDPLPYIVVIIDELADLMSVYPREVESSIVRLAQMARAVGIHLIVATQRPSVEVITGLIKANITTRMAFQVASQIDSRTVLDTAGAEKLLGNGDMLFLSADSGKPRRIQGAFVSEEEVKNVVKFLKDQTEGPVYNESIFAQYSEGGEGGGGFNGGDGGDDDPLYIQACDAAMQAGKISASFLQRRLSIGYARAARLLDIMEERGVVGPANGAKPREVLNRDGLAGASVSSVDAGGVITESEI